MLPSRDDNFSPPTQICSAPLRGPVSLPPGASSVCPPPLPLDVSSTSSSVCPPVLPLDFSSVFSSVCPPVLPLDSSSVSASGGSSVCHWRDVPRSFVARAAVGPSIAGTSLSPCLSPALPFFPASGCVPLYSVGGPVWAMRAGGVDSPFVDSGATYHLTGDRSLFTGSPVAVDTPVTGIDSSSSLRATEFGDIRVFMGGRLTTLHEVFYVPGLEHTLVSVRALVRGQGASCTFTAQGVRIVLPGDEGEVWAPSTEGLYALSAYAPPLGFYSDVRRGRPQPNTFTGSLSLATLLHRRCGHLSFGSRQY